MKKILFAALLLSTFSVFSQEENKKDLFLNARKGKLFLNLSPEYRIAAYYNSSENEYLNKGFTNIDNQLSGPVISYSLNYFITNNLCLGFSHSFKNSLLTYNQEIETNNGSQKSINTLFMDYHFYLDYFVAISKNKQLFLRVGKTILNSSSDYSYRTNYYDETNKFLGYSVNQTNFKYFPFNYAFGYKKDRFDVSLGFYTSKSTPYFKDDTKVTVSYIRLNYNILKL